MVEYFRYSLFFLFLAVQISLGQNISVSASTDTTDYLVGDYIYLTIRVEYEDGIRISPPSLNDKLGPLEVVKVLPVEFEGDGNVQVFNYIISGYDSARIVVPPIPIEYFSSSSNDASRAESNEVEVFIHTLPVDPSQDIKDIKEPIRIPFDWLFWSLFILGLLLLALVAYFLYNRFKKPKEEVRIVRSAPPTPIHILALRSLDELSEKKLWQQGKVKDYHSELTAIIRKYFEDRYNFNSLEMTTAQSIIVLNRVMDNQKIIDITSKFLENADLVKFAKFKPLPSVNDEMMKQAYEIVNRTKIDDDPVGAYDV